MLEKLRLTNYTAIALLVAGKLSGIVALAVGGKARLLGGILLVSYGLFIAASIGVAIRGMRARAKEDDAEKALLRRMKEEGTLSQYLRDLEAEDRKASS